MLAFLIRTLTPLTYKHLLSSVQTQAITDEIHTPLYYMTLLLSSHTGAILFYCITHPLTSILSRKAAVPVDIHTPRAVGGRDFNWNC